MILPRRRKRDTFLPWVQLAADAAVINLILWGVFWLRFESGYLRTPHGVPDWEIYRNAFVVVTLVIVLFNRSQQLYRPARTFTFAGEAARICRSVAASTVVLTALTFFVRPVSFSRVYLVVSGLALAAGLALARVGLGTAVMAIDRARRSYRNILVIGSGDPARRLHQYYESHPRLNVRVVGCLDGSHPKGERPGGLEVLGDLGDIGAILRARREIHEVALCRTDLPQETLLQLILECERQMVGFRWTADLLGLIASKMKVSYVGGVTLLSFADSPLAEWENRVLKRTLDLALSAPALIVLSPLYLLLALVVKLDSPGPVFYGQQRIGQDGRRFVLFKFRTMRVGAERGIGPVWAKQDDPRRTRTGAFLRRTNLDELPQLWNVLKGDMSLVGPRPERPFFVSQFKEDIPRYMARHAVRSGLTGWAQVNGLRGDTSIEERTKYDLFYIENWSIWLDLRILLLTAWTTTLGRSRNAY